MVSGKIFEISTIGNFYIGLVLDGLQRLSGLFMLDILRTMSVNHQDAALPFTMSWAIANIISSFSENSLPENREYIKLLGVLMTALGAALSFFATNLFLLIVSWGFIFGSGYGLLYPQLSKQLKNINCVKLLPILETTPSLGAAVMPFILCILNSYYGLPGSYLLLSGIILNYLPFSVAAAYNFKLNIPSIKWRVRKRSSQYYVSKQDKNIPVSNESFIKCLEPDLILRISESENYEDIKYYEEIIHKDEINESRDSIKQQANNGTQNLVKKICPSEILSTDKRFDNSKLTFETRKKMLKYKNRILDSSCYNEIGNKYTEKSSELKACVTDIFNNSKCAAYELNENSLTFESDQNLDTVSMVVTLENGFKDSCIENGVKRSHERQFLDSKISDINSSNNGKEICTVYIEAYKTINANTTDNSFQIVSDQQTENSIQMSDLTKKHLMEGDSEVSVSTNEIHKTSNKFNLKNKNFKPKNDQLKNECKESIIIEDRKSVVAANNLTSDVCLKIKNANSSNTAKINMELENKIERNNIISTAILTSNQNYDRQIHCPSNKDLKHTSKLDENMLQIPLDIKVHVIECNLLGDEDHWFRNLEKKYLNSRKNSYRQHSNSMIPGTYDDIDFESLSNPKNNKSLEHGNGKSKLLNIFSISEKFDIKNGKMFSERSKKQSKILYVMAEIKPVIKFLHEITPSSFCIILTTIIFEFNLVTLITIFADFGNYIDNTYSNHKWILASFGIGGLIGKFCCCKISRTIPEQTHYIGVVLFLLTGLSIAGILFSANINWLAGFYCIIGALEGGISYIIPKFILEHINEDAHSKLRASKSFLSGIAIMGIPYLIGLSQHEYGDYDFLLQILSCSSVLCALLIYFLPKISKASDNSIKHTAKDYFKSCFKHLH